MMLETVEKQAMLLKIKAHEKTNRKQTENRQSFSNVAYSSNPSCLLLRNSAPWQLM